VNKAALLSLEAGARRPHNRRCHVNWVAINNRGLRLSPTDIVKNFLLGNAARFGADQLALALQRWADIIAGLGGVNAETFSRQFVSARLKRRITKSFVVSTFKGVFMAEVAEALTLPERHWYLDDEPPDEEDAGETDVDASETEVAIEPGTKRIPFSDFLGQLVACATAYGQLVRADTGVEALDRRLQNVRMIKAMQTYGFLMHLRVGGCSEPDLEKVLALTEAFLVRRHICRMRANETETAFARLCGTDWGNPLPEVAQTYREYSPGDERFREDFATARFGANLIERARYCLARVEMKQHGTHPELFVGGPDVVHVEHVIPKKIKTKKARKEFGDWSAYLGPDSEAQHPKYVSRIGNLTLFAGPLNIGVSNNPYHRKKAAYRKSGLKITNTLPDTHPEFRFEQVEERSARLAALAVELWPIA